MSYRLKRVLDASMEDEFMMLLWDWYRVSPRPYFEVYDAAMITAY